MKKKTDLSRSAMALKKRYLAEFEITDAAGLEILAEGLRAYDLARKCEREIETDGLTSRDRFGQVRSHPLLSTLRDARAQYLAAIKQLGLDLEPVRSGPGRPPGR